MTSNHNSAIPIFSYFCWFLWFMKILVSLNGWIRNSTTNFTAQFLLLVNFHIFRRKIDTCTSCVKKSFMSIVMITKPKQLIIWQMYINIDSLWQCVTLFTFTYTFFSFRLDFMFEMLFHRYLHVEFFFSLYVCLWRWIAFTSCNEDLRHFFR